VAVTESPAPDSVEINRETGVASFVWADGPAQFSLEDLRSNCPCAECRGLRERGLPVWPKPTSPLPLKLESAELVGGWGISFSWNDGHATGIYSWSVLRAWVGLESDDSV
jgi:DUF971 family protein